MSRYATLAGSLVSAIIDRAEALPLIAPPPQGTAAERLAVYTTGYRLRLAGAVKPDFPALGHYAGEAQMEDWLKAYVEAVPSHSFNLDHYALGFPAFLVKHTNDSFARDLALLEGGIADIFLRPDSEPLTPAGITGEFEEMKLALRTAAMLLELETPANAYLTAFRKGESPEKQVEPLPDFLLLHRHENEVRRKTLTPFQYRLLSLVDGKTPFGAIVAQLGDATPEDETAMQELFAYAFSGGVFRC